MTYGQQQPRGQATAGPLKQIKRIDLHKRGASVAWVGDTRIIVGAEDGIYAVDIRGDGVLTKIASPRGCNIVVVTPDRTGFAVVGYRSQVVVFDSVTLSRKVSYIHTSSSECVGQRFQCAAFSPNGKFFAAGTNSGFIVVWDDRDALGDDNHGGHQQRQAIVNEAVIAEGEHPSLTAAITSMAFLTDYELVVARSIGNVELWKLKETDLDGLDVELHYVKDIGEGAFVAVDRAGKKIAYTYGNLRDANGHVLVYDRAERITLTAPPRARRAPLPSERTGIVEQDGVARTIPLIPLEENWPLYCPSSYSVVFVNDDCVASGGADGTVRLWRVTYPAASPDGNHVAQVELAAQRLLSRVFGLPAVKINEVAKGGANNGLTVGLSVSPDGRFLASIGTDGTVNIWDISQYVTAVP